MKRYNIFYQVHKGLREMLFDTASKLQQTDFSDADETCIILSKVESVLNLFDKHADTEDKFVLTAIESYEPSVTVLFADEHVQDHKLCSHLRSLVSKFSTLTETEEMSAAGSAIRLAFIEFLVFNLMHMAKEEKVLNNLLWKYYDDRELVGITQEILAHLPPDILQQYSVWMMRALSISEITNWLSEVKNSAPEFVFESLMQTARQELNTHRWLLVQESLTEGAMLA
jgi:hemerythrin-like domain-containing protein